MGLLIAAPLHWHEQRRINLFLHHSGSKTLLGSRNTFNVPCLKYSILAWL